MWDVIKIVGVMILSVYVIIKLFDTFSKNDV